MQTVVVPAGQHAELYLADGTHVWLNSGSRLTFPGRFSKKVRHVELDGEGYFKVISDQEIEGYADTRVAGDYILHYNIKFKQAFQDFQRMERR